MGPVENVANDGVTLESSAHAHSGQQSTAHPSVYTGHQPGASEFMSEKQH